MNPSRTREYLYEEYIVKKRSVGDIAAEHKTYANKIRRELIYYGISLRDKSDAQSAAINSGRHKHPTKGTTRPDDVKSRIGKKVSVAWENAPEAEKEPKVRSRQRTMGKHVRRGKATVAYKGGSGR